MSVITPVRPNAATDTRDPVFQAFWIPRIGFTVAPILFGIDKFLNWLVDWPIYLAPRIDDVIPGNAHQAMLAVGGGEILARGLVFLPPPLRGYLGAAPVGGGHLQPLHPRA